jgi:hypothetical protein
MHPTLEDRSDKRIEAGTAVEGAHQLLDHHFVDAAALDDILDDQIADWDIG